MAIRLGASKTYKTPVKEEPKSEPIRLGTAARKRDEPIRLGKAAEKKIPTPVEQMENIGIKSKIGQAAFAGGPAIIATLGLGAIAGTGAFLAAGAAKAASANAAINIASIQAGGGAITAQTAGVAGISVSTATATAAGTSIATKSFGATVLAYGGVAAWVSSVGFGLWGVAESPEPISIAQTKFLIPEAMKTGDWSKVDEAELAKAELLDLAIWEKILIGTPAAAIIGSMKKLEGHAIGAVIITQYINDQKIQQETGESDEEKWDRIRQQQIDDDKNTVDYYNTERKKMVNWELEAKEEQRDDDAKFWANERIKQTKLEKEDREAVAEFWLNYRKEALKIAESNRPSNLNFGLI